MTSEPSQVNSPQSGWLWDSWTPSPPIHHTPGHLTPEGSANQQTPQLCLLPPALGSGDPGMVFLPPLRATDTEDKQTVERGEEAGAHRWLGRQGDRQNGRLVTCGPGPMGPMPRGGFILCIDPPMLGWPAQERSRDELWAGGSRARSPPEALGRLPHPLYLVVVWDP